MRVGVRVETYVILLTRFAYSGVFATSLFVKMYNQNEQLCSNVLQSAIHSNEHWNELSRDQVPSSNILSVDHSIACADSGI